MENLQPMISINVYLLPEFRREIFNTVLGNLDSLESETRQNCIQTIKEFVKISGFRNPFAAPHPLLARNLEAPFEKESRIVKAILTAWAEIKKELQPLIRETIASLNFIQNNQAPDYPDPENAFIVGWPEKLSFDQLSELVHQKANISASKDEIALMTVWLTGCLPSPQQTPQEE